MLAVPRRAFLRSAAGAALLLSSGLLAACGGGAAGVASSTSQAPASSQSTTTTPPGSVTGVTKAQTSSRVAAVSSATISSPSVAVTPTAPVTQAAAGVVTLQMLNIWSPDGWAVQQRYDRAFEQKNPDIKISGSNLAFNADTTSKLLALGAAGSLPDIVRAHPNYEVRFAAAGLWADLVPYVGRTKDFNLQGDFLPASLQYHQRHGKLTAIPFTATTTVLFYNKDLFDRAGLAYPTKQWSYTGDFFNAVQKLTQRTGAAPSVGWSGQMPQPADVTSDPVFLHPWGGAFLNDAETACELDQRASIDAATWWLDLKNKYQFTPQATDKGYAFETGQVAMMYQLAQELIVLRQGKTAFRWDVAQLPKGPVTSSAGIGAGAYGITSNSKHPDVAWTYLDAYTSTAGLTFMFADSGLDLPARKSAWPAFLKRPGHPEHVQAFFDAGAHAITFRPFGAEGPDVISKTSPIWADALSGKRDVATVSAEVCRVADGVLKSESSDMA